MNNPKVNNVFHPIFASLPKNGIRHPRLSYAKFSAQISQLLVIPNSRVAISTYMSEERFHLRLTIDYGRGEKPKRKTSDSYIPLAERLSQLGIEQVVLYSGIKEEQILNLIAQIDPTSSDTSNRPINALKSAYSRHKLITIKFKKEPEREKDQTLPFFSLPSIADAKAPKSSEEPVQVKVNKKIAKALLKGSAELKDLILQDKSSLEISPKTKVKTKEWIKRVDDVIEHYLHEIKNEGIKDLRMHHLFKRLEARKRKIQELADIKIDEVKIPSTRKSD